LDVRGDVLENQEEKADRHFVAVEIVLENIALG